MGWVWSETDQVEISEGFVIWLSERGDFLYVTCFAGLRGGEARKLKLGVEDVSWKICDGEERKCVTYQLAIRVSGRKRGGGGSLGFDIERVEWN